MHKYDADMLRSLLEGPLPRNALWRDVIALMEHIGTVENHGNNKLQLSVGSEQRTFVHAGEKQLTTQELSELRHFLLASGIGAPARDGGDAGAVEDRICVVVIDHHAARFYWTTGASRPDAGGKIVPLDPRGFHRHLIHREEASHYQGDRVPEDTAFYKNIATALKDTQEIVIIGHGTGKSDAAAYLVSYLHKNAPEIAARIVGAEAADLSALTEPEVEALAERHVAGRGKPA